MCHKSQQKKKAHTHFERERKGTFLYQSFTSLGNSVSPNNTSEQRLVRRGTLTLRVSTLSKSVHTMDQTTYYSTCPNDRPPPNGHFFRSPGNIASHLDTLNLGFSHPLYKKLDIFSGVVDYAFDLDN